MSGDMSNAELGVATSDAIGGKRRFDNPNGFNDQQSWGLTYLNERLIGSVSVLILALIIFVWVIDTSAVIKFSVSGLAILSAIVLGSLALRQRNKTLALREQQASQYNS